MDSKKRDKLAAKGFTVGSVTDFLQLTPAKAAFIGLRLEIGKLLTQQRKKKRWTQARLAETIGSSQSRVAKMESGDVGVTIDLMIRALFQLGLDKKQLGRALSED